MTRRLRRHRRRDLYGGRAIDVPGGSCGTLRGWDGGGWYRSVIHLREWGLEGGIGWSAECWWEIGGGGKSRGRTAASGISVSRLGWGRPWFGGSIGSGGGRSGIEWMLSIEGIGVDTSEASGWGSVVSSAILFVAIGNVLGCSLVPVC